ncbi:hypothetical protein DENIS_3575 [Desulfonema ishimotonii]|uniref:Tyrosine specific protein phosphatases domain-containing protein n=1 Tax=Desulfonema ishimotonii TaxID=45657 RepID=A0A401G095_9BACT|nr:dual specificity protein phosphatase family protein [Desulfonema ishimotonii]GBC62603.1 hypothetical protein DENIS_3575 [Desulfonema ishimotonii]
MPTKIFWIDVPSKGKIGIMPRPRGGDWLKSEITSFQNEGVDIMVSLLTFAETEELGLCEEASLCEHCGITFYSLPIPDRNAPESILKTKITLDLLNNLSKQGKNIAIHCRQGIGRSGLIAASVLVNQSISVSEAFRRIEAARGCTVPDTAEQKEWVSSFADFISTGNRMQLS